MTDLPKDVSDMLVVLPAIDAKTATVEYPPIGAQHDRPGLKVVDIAAHRNADKPGDEWRDAVKTLRAMADRLESGEDSPFIRCAMAIHREDGSLDVCGVGPEADDLSLIALLSLGLQQIQSEMLY